MEPWKPRSPVRGFFTSNPNNLFLDGVIFDRLINRVP
jgi:hypothetical protein